MSKSAQVGPTFNLWTEPWIMLERPDGGVERLGIEQTLLRAHEYTAIYEPSPLVVVGIHRLLVAILQAVIDPQKNADLKKLWKAGHFPVRDIQTFGKQYAERFNLFSEKAPFLQSADLPMQAGKGDKAKTIAYLAAEMPAGTGITHYRHGTDSTQMFCPACAAYGLVCIPAFATSGGAGIKPSINGVPPIYVLPGGRSLLESLVASLLTPEYQPLAASPKRDDAWWLRKPVVRKAYEVREVGYLHSLTFPARRVRLHPEQASAACTRCGQASQWGVRTMIFEMGESRPKGAAFWFDPFAAYKLPEDKSKDKSPTPVRPAQGKALWREFAALFLQGAQENKRHTYRPSVLDQIAALDIGQEWSSYPFRCIGVRTDMKAKVFEWVDAGFQVPPALLRDETAGPQVSRAIQFTGDCTGIIAGAFRDAFGGSAKKARHEAIRARMIDEYWSSLASPFRDFILALAPMSFDQRETELHRWAEAVVQKGLESFKRVAELIGDDAASLRQRVQGEQRCVKKLYGYKKKQFPQGGMNERTRP